MFAQFVVTTCCQPSISSCFLVRSIALEQIARGFTTFFIGVQLLLRFKFIPCNSEMKKKNHQGVDLKCCFSVDWKFSAEVAATPTKSNRQKSESPGKIIITIEKNHWYWTLGHHIKLRVWCMTVRMLQNAIRATSFRRPFNFLHHFLFTLYVSFNWLTLSKFCRAFKQLIKCSTLRWPSITTKHSFRFI